MEDHSLASAVKSLCERDNRYHPDAYYFVVDAIDYTARSLQRDGKDAGERHVTGQELCEGIRRFAHEQFGPMALTVLRRWGVGRTEDFGEIVFNLIGAEKLRKTPSDRKEDFANVYEFHTAFAAPYLPRGKTPPRRGGRPRRGGAPPAAEGRQT